MLGNDKDAYVSDLGSLNFRYALNWLKSYKSEGSNLPHKKDGTKGLVSIGNTIFWVVVKVPSNFVMTLRQGFHGTCDDLCRSFAELSVTKLCCGKRLY
jgi:hypothetical protein